MAKDKFTPVDPVYRIPDIAIDDQMLVDRAIERANGFLMDRAEWISRREECYLGWDDYLSPVYKGLWDGSCFLPGTDILTKRGWVPAESVTTKDYVFSKNPKTGELGFIPVNVTWQFEKSNSAVRFFNSRGIDITVTDNHRMYLIDERGGMYKNRHCFIEAKDLTGENKTKKKKWGIPRNGIFNGGHQPLIPDGVSPEDWFELWGWYLAEGSYCSANHHWIEISQSKKANEEKYNIIKSLCERLPFEFYEGKNGNYFRIKLPVKWRIAFASTGLQPCRFIPRPLLEAPAHLLKIMFEAMMLGDGSVGTKNGSKTKHRTYGTSSFQLASDVQELLVKIGLWGSIYKSKTKQGRDFYNVSVHLGERTALAEVKIEKVDYTGPSYCVTTDWGVVYARMNGHPLFIGQSNLHLPMTEVQCAAMHARIMQSIFFVNPPFFIDPQEDMDELRIQKMERFMKYILVRYVNFNKGIYNAIDDWAWDLTTEGVGIFSRDWRHVQRYFTTIERNELFENLKIDLEKALSEDMDEADFKRHVDEMARLPFVEKRKVRDVFNGPVVTAEDPDYILFKGEVVDSTDLNEHETVIKVCYFTPDELKGFMASEYMDEDNVRAILDTEPDNRGTGMMGTRFSARRSAMDKQTGVVTQHAVATGDSYEFLCVYDTVSLDNNNKYGCSDRLVYFVHPKSRKLTRWTFLDRISATGKIPLHMAHLYRRPRRSIGRGIVETQYSLNQMSDILANQSIDAGMLANNPMGAFRGGGTFDPEEFKVEPGLWVKTDDPNQDLRILNWNVNPNWSLALQNMISGYSSQMTSLGPESSGQIGNRIGPLRSGSGFKGLMQERDVQLDIVYKRVNGCVSDLFDGLYEDCYQRMPETMKVSVVGMNGEPVLGEDGQVLTDDISKSDLRSKVHFGLYANSMNTNRLAQLESSMQVSQMLLQRVALETGIVKPHNVYNIYDQLLTDMGKMRKDRFISKPEAGFQPLPLAMELMAVVQGLYPPVVMNDPEHEMKVEKLTELRNSDVAQMEVQYGKAHKNTMALIDKLIAEHTKYLTILMKAQSVNNPTGSNVSPTLGLQQGQGAPEVPQGEQPEGEIEGGSGEGEMTGEEEGGEND